VVLDIIACMDMLTILKNWHQGTITVQKKNPIKIHETMHY
jgi:hypothetical protein